MADPMAQNEEEDFPPAAEGEEGSGPGSEGDSNLDEESVQSEDESQSSSASESAIGEIGLIESVQLENFMCHAMLGPVRFGPNLNFLVGGKGKSALLSALVVGLSRKSLELPLRDFVKEGETSANISITLRNTGDSAFKPDMYGESITLQKCISVDTDPWYELNDQAGNVISCEEEEFLELLDNFQIRMDNPAAILQQEMSKQLLQIRDDNDRYKLFMKATKLQQMREEYSEILEKKVKSQQELDQGKQELENLTCQGRTMEKHYQNMVALKKKLENSKHEMAWALVEETERDIVELTTNIIIGEQHTVTLKEEVESSKAKFDEAEKKQRTIRENIQKLKGEVAALEFKCTEARKSSEKSDRAHIEAEAFFYSSQNELNQLERVAEQLHNKIESLKKRQALTEVEKQNKISMLKQELKNFRDQEESFFQEIKHIHRIVEKDDEEHFRLKKEEASIQQTLNKQQQELNRLKDCKSEPLKRFGPEIPTLVEAIEDVHKQGRFTSKPLGPLGACIRLRDPEFALAVECCLKGLLLAFFCDNHEDELVLRELMEKVYPLGFPRPQIIVSAFECQLYDVTDRAACHPEFPTVLTALEIDHAVVANTLIDMRGIESVLLVKSNSLAHTVMHGQGLPKNCSKVLTASGDEVYEGCYSSCAESSPAFLGDMDIEISNLEKEAENKAAQLAAYHQHLCSLEKDMKKNRDALESRYRYLREMRVTELNLSSEMKDLEDETEKESTRLSVVEKEAQENKGSIKEVSEKMKVRKEKMENLRRLKIDDEQIFEDLKFKCNQVSKSLQSLMEEENQAVIEVDTQQRSVLHCESKFKEYLQSLKERKERLTIKKRELQKETVLAKYICPERVEVTRAASLLDREIEMLKQTIESEKFTYGSQEEIKKQFQEIKERCLDLNAEVKHLKKLIVTLDEMSCQRYIAYQKRRRNLSIQSKLYFRSLLSQWAIWGEVNLDHEKETLSLTVQPAEENRDVFSGTQVFSGDTLSFSNFLFIISLWSITESPFRCLDSFDIYMNSDQRNIAMDMILSIAHSQRHSQFLLIIPEFVSCLPSSPLIEILQIPDHESCEESPPLEEVDSEEEED